METGTTSFLDRMALTERLDDHIKPFLQAYGFRIADFGHPVLSKGNSYLGNLLRQRPYKKSKEILFVKFSPDFVLAPSEQSHSPFFMDTKASITPVFFQSQINRIKQQAGLNQLKREDIFVIEREAWDTYNKIYPKEKVAIFIACPYNPRLLLGEWVSNLTDLFRFKQDHNDEAGGSGTPHVNIHMGMMRTLKEFLIEEFEVDVDQEDYSILLEYIKLWPINKPRGRVNWTQFNNVIASLKRTCPWLEYRNMPERWQPPIL